MIVSKFITTHKMNLFKPYSTAFEVIPKRLKYIFSVTKRSRSDVSRSLSESLIEKIEKKSLTQAFPLCNVMG